MPNPSSFLFWVDLPLRGSANDTLQGTFAQNPGSKLIDSPREVLFWSPGFSARIWLPRRSGPLEATEATAAGLKAYTARYSISPCFTGSGTWGSGLRLSTPLGPLM